MKLSTVLRQKAEELHKMKQSETKTPLAEDEVLRLMQELEIHQIELELQNEELMLAKSASHDIALKYTRFFDLAPIGYFALSYEGTIIEVNLCGANMFGKERLLLVSARFGFFVSDNTKHIFNLFLGQIFSSKAFETCEVTLSMNGNLPVYIQLTGIANENGMHCLVTAVDITERKLAEQALLFANIELAFQNKEKAKRADELLIANKELAFQNEEKAKRADELLIANKELAFQNEEKIKRAAELIIANKEIAFQKELIIANSFLENLINNANAPIIVWNPQFCITRFNHAFELLTGRHETEVLGKSLEILFPQKLAANSMALMRKTLSGKMLEAIEIEIQHLDNSVRVVLWNSATLFTPDGQTPIATIAQGQDITDRKRFEHQLGERLKELRTLYNLTRLAEREDISLERFYQDLVGFLAEGWQYPENTCSRIIVEGVEFRSANFEESEWKQTTPIKINESILGLIEVTYLKEMPKEDEGPFLKEERFLIDAIAGQLHQIIVRRKSQIALQENKVRLEKAMQTAKMAWWEMDVKTGNVIFEKSKAEMLGYQAEEFTHFKDFVALVHPEDQDNAIDAMRRHYSGKSDKYAFDYRILTKTEGYKWFHDIGSIVKRGQGGIPLKVTGLTINITERKEAEAEMAKQSELITMLLDSIPDIIFFKDTKGVYMGCNPPFAAFVGKTRNEIVGKTDYDLFDKDIADFFRQNDIEMLKQKLPRHNEEWVSWPNGRKGLLDTLKTPYWSGDGNLIGILGISRDITAKKENEVRIKESEERYRALVEWSPYAALVHRDMKIVYANPAAVRLFGATSEQDLVGTPVMRWHHPDYHQIVQERIRKAREEGLAAPMIESKYFKLDGSVMDLEVQGKPIVYNGAPAILATFHDVTERNQSENAMMQVHARHRSMIANISDVISIMDADGLVKYISPNIEKIFGWLPEELIGTDGFAVIHPDDLEIVQKTFFRYLEEENSTKTMEVRYKCRNGSYLPIEVTTTNLLNDPLINGVLTNYHDISERKKVELETARQSALINSLLNSIPDMIFFKDLEGVYLGGNPTFFQVFGKSKEDIIGKTAYDLFDKEIADEINASDIHILAQKSVFTYEEMVTLSNGKKVLFETQKLPLYNGYGVIAGIIGVSRDITERKEAENRQRESEERFDKLSEHSRVITWEIDANGLYTYMSHACLSVLGYQPEELVGKKYFYDLHPENGRESFKAAAFEIFNSKNFIHNLENAIQSIDGQIIWVSTNGIPILDENGKLAGYSGTDTDITERKLAVEALKQASARLSLATYAGGVGVWDYDLTNNKLLWDDQMLSLYGIEKENFAGAYQTWLAGVHPDDVVRGNEEIEMAISGEKEFNTEFRVVWPDGSVHHIRALAFVQLNDSGIPIRMIGTNWDITEQKSLEEKLKFSEANFHTFFESMDDLIFVGNLKGEIIYSNNTVSRKLGYSTQELLGKPVINMHPLSKRSEAEQIFGEMFAGKRDVCPLPLARKDGTLIPVETHIWFGKWDGSDCIFGISKDLTKEQESLQKFNKIFDNNPALMAISTIPDGIFTEVNQAFISKTRFAKDEIIGKTPSQLGLFQQSDMQRFAAKELAKNGSIHNIGLKIKTRSGDILDGIFSGEIIDNQGVKYFLTVMLDITESKKLEDEIKIQNDFYNIISTISGKLIQAGSENLDTEINHSLKMLGLFNNIDRSYIFELDSSKDEVNNTYEWCADGILPEIDNLQGVPFSFMPFWVEAFLNNEHLYIESVSDLPEGRNTEKNILTLQGIQSLVAVPMYYGSSLIGFIGFDSVTEKKQWNEQVITLLKIYAGVLGGVIHKKKTELILLKAIQEAEIANKSKSRFLANMSHEIRTPLNAIIGFSQLMNRDKLLTNSQKEYTTSINRAGEHLLSLINDILELSKVEAGRVVLNPTSFDLWILLKDLMIIFKERTQSKHLKLFFENATELPRFIFADESKLRQIFINLIGNAVKFTNEGGITVKTSVAIVNNDKIQLIADIIDTGSGIAENELDKLFKNFEQTTSGIKQGTGTGLGLALSRELAILMGGNITVVSQVGKGTVFTFYIEIKPGTEEKTATKTNRRIIGIEKSQKAYRILVVDDKAENLQVAVNFLRMVGFETNEAVNGEQAIIKFDEWNPDLILMDLRMPEMDGYEATRRIKSTEKGRCTPIMALTASLFEEDNNNLISLGLQGYIRKPFREIELFGPIGKVLGIQYLYEDETPISSTKYVNDNVAISRDIAKLPDNLVSKMREAVSVADSDAFIELINGTKQVNPELAQLLISVANNFDWDYLQRLLSIKDNVNAD